MEVWARAAAATATRLRLSVARNLGSRCRMGRCCTHPPALRRRNRHQMQICTCWSITRRGHLRRGSRAAGAALAESWERVLSLVRLLDGHRAVSISLHVHEPGAHACLAVFGQLDELSRRRRWSTRRWSSLPKVQLSEGDTSPRAQRTQMASPENGTVLTGGFRQTNDLQYYLESALCRAEAI